MTSVILNGLKKLMAHIEKYGSLSDQMIRVSLVDGVDWEGDVLEIGVDD